MYDVVLFDLDGTLCDSLPDIAAALDGALADCDMPQHGEAAVARMVGGGVDALVRRAVAPMASARIPDVTARFRARYAAHPVEGTRLYPGVEATLARLASTTERRGPIPMAVATNKPGPLARAVCDRLGIARYFHAVLGEDDVGRRKPDPAIVSRLLEALPGGATKDRARVLFVGDSPVDAATAAAAGLPFCLCTWGYATDEERAAVTARHRIDRFADLLAIVDAPH